MRGEWGGMTCNKDSQPDSIWGTLWIYGRHLGLLGYQHSLIWFKDEPCALCAILFSSRKGAGTCAGAVRSVWKLLCSTARLLRLYCSKVTSCWAVIKTQDYQEISPLYSTHMCFLYSCENHSAQKCVTVAVQGADPGTIREVGAVHGNYHSWCWWEGFSQAHSNDEQKNTVMSVSLFPSVPVAL